MHKNIYLEQVIMQNLIFTGVHMLNALHKQDI